MTAQTITELAAVYNAKKTLDLHHLATNVAVFHILRRAQLLPTRNVLENIINVLSPDLTA
jgi:hypothetical protein